MSELFDNSNQQYLLVDIGNSRIKWCLASSGGLIKLKSNAPLNSNALDNPRNQLDEPISSVVLKQIEDTIPHNRQIALTSVHNSATSQFLRHFSEYSVFKAKTSQRALGLTSGYGNPDSLGVDRWLAMLGGRQLLGAQSFVVVDSGTATTIDYVTTAGLHAGGFIVPGLNMQVQSLLQTSNVKASLSLNNVGFELGSSTQSCVMNGVLTQTVTLVEHVFSRYKQSDGCKLILTGGAGKLLFEHLKKSLVGIEDQCILAEDLVFQGLLVLLLEELKKN